MNDSLRDKDAISELISSRWSLLKGAEYRIGMTVDFVAGATLVLAPDAWVLNAAEWRKAIREDDYPAGVPELAVILHSAAARIEDTRFKIGAYLNCGARSVWLLNTREQIVFAFDPQTEDPLLFSAGQILHLPEPLPRMQVPVEEISALENRDRLQLRCFLCVLTYQHLTIATKLQP